MVLLLLPLCFAAVGHQDPSYCTLQVATCRRSCLETLQAVLFSRIPKRLNLNDAFVLFLSLPSGTLSEEPYVLEYDRFNYLTSYNASFEKDELYCLS